VVWNPAVQGAKKKKKKANSCNGTEQGGAAIAPACGVEEQLFAVTHGDKTGLCPENFSGIFCICVVLWGRQGNKSRFWQIIYFGVPYSELK